MTYNLSTEKRVSKFDFQLQTCSATPRTLLDALTITEDAPGKGKVAPGSVGLYNLLNPADRQLFLRAWFQPLNVSSDFLVSMFAFKWVNLYRYGSVRPHSDDKYGGDCCTSLLQCDP
jgi:hypothetical protein